MATYARMASKKTRAFASTVLYSGVSAFVREKTVGQQSPEKCGVENSVKMLFGDVRGRFGREGQTGERDHRVGVPSRRTNDKPANDRLGQKPRFTIETDRPQSTSWRETLSLRAGGRNKLCTTLDPQLFAGPAEVTPPRGGSVGRDDDRRFAEVKRQNCNGLVEVFRDSQSHAPAFDGVLRKLRLPKRLVSSIDAALLVR